MSNLNTIPRTELLRARGQLISLNFGALLMGVLNVTPDSFSDGGRHYETGAAVEHALIMIEQGADLIDIGAESSRPGADPITEEEEARRLLPVVTAICRKVSVPVSVDTTKARVAQRALDAGAAIVNDISALRFDHLMGQVVAKTGAGLILMHMHGTPKTMQRDPQYRDVVAEVRQFFVERMKAAEEAGINPEQILLDPGFGFGKNVIHNLTLLTQLDQFAALGRPIVAGVSRKAFIGQVLDRQVGERLMGTAAAVAVAVLRGARIVRVHEVGPMRDVVKMVEAIRHA